MDPVQLGYFSFLLLLVLIFLGMPIALAMTLIGLGGSYLIFGSILPLLNQLNGLAYSQFSSHSLTIVPLFLLMGQLATVGGISKALFKFAETFLGHRKGGIAMAAIGAGAGFGAVCGSSLATAATMGQVALPELRRVGYDPALATGALAAGGTLGILIPPSIVLVIYAILAEQNVAVLFGAAMIPGILAAIGYMMVISVQVHLNPRLASDFPRASWPERLRAMVQIWPVVAIFIVVIGGIYGGIFTPTEGASVGVIITFILAWSRGGVNRANLKGIIVGTASASAMIYFIVLGAGVFNTFLALSQMPQELAQSLTGAGLGPYVILAAILIGYLILGCVMDSLSMILLTVPILFPIVSNLDFGMSASDAAIWFGVLVLIVVEVGLITPPVGMNLFIIHGLAPDIPIEKTYRGVMPFVLSDLIRVLLLIAFPSIVLWLPRLLY